MDDPETIRLKLDLQYDGSGFHGWQLQPDHRTVQGELEAALSRLADRPRSVLASGRTDAGVHAIGQVASVDMPAGWSAEALERALNALLPDDVRVTSVEVAAPDFHPRYDALTRTYEYRIGTAHEAASPFHRRWCWPLDAAVDVPALHGAARLLPGGHSFRSFAKSGQPERGERCTVTEARWSEWQLGIAFRVSANRFLHHMVRYLVGTLVDVGLGVRPESDVLALLRGSEGVLTSPPAPPQGLFLLSVEYTDPRARREPSELRSHTTA